MYRRISLLIALAFMALSTTGCLDSDPDDQSVPWSRPAEWERGAPGMGKLKKNKKQQQKINNNILDISFPQKNKLKLTNKKPFNYRNIIKIM
jgi:hypothetical protein